MSAEIPTSVPDVLVAGDTWRWDITYPDFDASAGDQLAYALRGAQDLAIVWGTHVTASGSGFAVRVPASSTNLPAGTYRIVGFITSGSERDTVELKTVTLMANPATAVATASHDERVLAALDAAIEGRVTKDQEDITINGRSVKHIPFGELLQYQGIYRERVAAARNDEAFQIVEVRFAAP